MKEKRKKTRKGLRIKGIKENKLLCISKTLTALLMEQTNKKCNAASTRTPIIHTYNSIKFLTLTSVS